MYIKLIKSISIIGILISSHHTYASDDPLIGTWKTIDERTGYSLSDTHISKLKDGTYKATIIAVRATPGAPISNICSKCNGELKNKPLVGFSPLYGLKVSRSNKAEFTNGIYIDTKTGVQYQSHVRLSNNGKHLNIRNTQPNSTIGRNLMWVKY